MLIYCPLQPLHPQPFLRAQIIGDLVRIVAEGQEIAPIDAARLGGNRLVDRPLQHRHADIAALITPRVYRVEVFPLLIFGIAQRVFQLGDGAAQLQGQPEPEPPLAVEL